CCMIAAMSYDLQRQHKHMTDPRAILLHLELYSEKSGITRYQLSKELFWNKMLEGAFVNDHCLKMISCIEQLASLGFIQDAELSTNLILLTVEANMDHGRSKSNVMLLPSSSSWTTDKKDGSKSKGKAPIKKIGKKGKKPLAVAGDAIQKRIRYLSDEKACFYCGKQGHWKSWCTEFLKSTAGGTSGSGTFMIESFLAYNVSSTWVVDSDCGTNICNSL
ncbi:LOW QUALITY PROTEIN: hypothetical protein CFOL_v3_13533, partial [Cephalotus follicularis]